MVGGDLLVAFRSLDVVSNSWRCRRGNWSEKAVDLGGKAVYLVHFRDDEETVRCKARLRRCQVDGKAVHCRVAVLYTNMETGGRGGILAG